MILLSGDMLIAPSMTAVTKAAPLPALASLYPVLSFLVGNDEDDQGGGGGDDGGSAADAGQTQKDKKRPLPPSDGDSVLPVKKIGKRAEGRAEYQQKIKATTAPKNEEGEGEKQL